MIRRGPRPAGHSRPEAGYALLMAVFLAATMFVLATVAAPSIVNNGRRQREQQLIWRGNQYVRGIRLYFQKNGRFPQNREELLKGTLNVHFVRKAFADPVAPQGGDWRFIYVAPSSGQLTGSVRYHTLQEMAAALGGGPNAGSSAALFGGPPAAPGAGAAGAAGVGRGGAAGAGRGATPGAAAGARGGGAAGQTAGGLEPVGAGPTPVPLQAVDGPVLGASLIGVASKVKKDSLLVYQGKDTYFEWEFIWNPLLNRGAGGTQTPQAPGAAPTGGGIGAGEMPPVGAPGQQGPGPGQMPGPGMPGMPRVGLPR